MFKRKKILIAVLSMVVLVSMIIGGVTALAADPTTTPTPTPTTTTTTTAKDAYLEALAAKLNIPVDQLKAAIESTNADVVTQALENRLDKLVTAGTITQEQADQFLTWWQARPDVPLGDIIPGFQKQIGKGSGFRGMMGGKGWCQGYNDEVPATTTTPSSTST